MTVRLKLALTIFITGALTALGVIATVLVAFQRFEHETTYYRANAFLNRVVAMYDNMFEMHERHPDEFTGFLRNLVLFEPDTQLYLLDAQGTVLAFTGEARLPPGFKVDLRPVREAVGDKPMPYVMGDDPERMDADAVIAAKTIKRAVIRNDEPMAGYLYLVAHQRTSPEDRWQVLGSSLGKPAVAGILGVVGLSSLLAWWVIAMVTRPLRQLSDAVAAVSREGLGSGAADPDAVALPSQRAGEEFSQLAVGFRAMLRTLRQQWEALRRLDHFRREGVSNLSHDLRSPLTATAACLETLETRWAGQPDRAEDLGLVSMALRNTRNAARLVQSLGDLAQLDEPEFKIQAEVLDAGELLDDIALRFGERAAQRGVGIAAAAQAEGEPPFAALDIELFERAIANLVDNALKFCRPGDRIALSAKVEDDRVSVCVEDTGPGIPPADVPHLFDRFYQSRQSVAPATGEGGKGLGLAIVKRIAELHGGDVFVQSELGRGTKVALSLPRAML
ncbi:sensor histidine kinase [Piscinibacter terrae]|uniref:histidine kinase n=1 Tax=Piscinibacter terrae TaxID=2496871 RepID=A0A3N7HQE5_9BURK|nr:HAMP domain-containing sensor histidine kinase [Albitalea terrae]RQP24430.1 sensor histidine kinase [Albitalea terrae]